MSGSVEEFVRQRAGHGGNIDLPISQCRMQSAIMAGDMGNVGHAAGGSTGVEVTKC